MENKPESPEATGLDDREVVYEIYSFDSNEWVECDKWEHNRTEEKHRRISVLSNCKNKKDMSWSDTCSNCGQHRADCDCGDWNGYKAKRAIKEKIREEAEAWYHTSEGFDKIDAYIAGAIRWAATLPQPDCQQCAEKDRENEKLKEQIEILRQLIQDHKVRNAGLMDKLGDQILTKNTLKAEKDKFVNMLQVAQSQLTEKDKTIEELREKLNQISNR